MYHKRHTTNIKYVITMIDAYDAFDHIMNAFQRLVDCKNLSPYSYYRMDDSFIESQQKYINTLLSHAEMTFNTDTTIDIKRIYNNVDNNFFQSTDGYIMITKTEPQFSRYTRFNLITVCIFKFITNQPLKAYKHFNEEMITNVAGLPIHAIRMNTYPSRNTKHKTIVEKPSVLERFKSWITSVNNKRYSNSFTSNEVELDNLHT